MGQKLILFIFFFLTSIGFAEPQNLKTADIRPILSRFFSYHIENKELNTTLVRRAIKIYIENFDPEKAYLLEGEISSYLNLNEKQAQKILNRFQKEDYSDFEALNELFQGAIFRSQEIRAHLISQFMKGELSIGEFNSVPAMEYADAESELIQRQKSRMARFFAFQKSRSNVDTLNRKAKVFALYNKKVSRIESIYLFQEFNGNAMLSNRIENILTVKILKAFAKSLDTHTTFFSPEEAYEMRLNLEKQFEGVGVVLSEGIDGIVIAELIKGSPAAVSGKIQTNDILVSIDGDQVSQMPFEEVLALLKKKNGGEIHFEFRRIDYTTNREINYHINLKKQPIAMNEERIRMSSEKFGSGVIGKIALYSFYENSDGISSERDIKAAIQSFKQAGDLQGLVLDLRENSGGFLSQAVKVAGLFISNGIVVVSKYGKNDKHYLRSISGRPFFNGPLVILTSKMSASAAEIVAQALQDYGVGLVVGDERTFGKGSIQYQTVTDEKADLFFKVTVGRYYTVSGKSTQINGVIADIVLPTQYAPFNIGEKYLEYPLPVDAVEPVFNDPLTDLDDKTQKIFEKHYLPYTQRVVPFWKRMLPDLRKNSARRLANNPDFQSFLRRIEKIQARQDSLPPNTIDEYIYIGLEDLQMNESVNILKDMIYIEAENRPKEAALIPTGS